MSKQWGMVAVVLAALGIGAGALVRFGADIRRVEVGAPAPDFKLANLSTGDSISLRSHYRGSVTLVNIWATWCGPCRVEMPAMQELYDSLSSHGFRIAAVSVDEGPPIVVRQFAKEMGLTFDLLHDRSMKIQKVYQTTGVPESFLLDRDGIITKRVIGAHDWNSPANRRLVERLLAEPAH